LQVIASDHAIRSQIPSLFFKQKKDQSDIPTGLFFCGDERNHRLLAQALPKSSPF
jgi:hypothetical protein